MTFTACYHGACHACGEHVNPGDQVTWVDDEIVHTDCDTPTGRPVPPPAEICTDCWVTKPCWCEP